MLDERGSIHGRGNEGTPHHRVHTGSGVHKASYPMYTKGSFLGGKAARTWSSSLISIYCRG